VDQHVRDAVGQRWGSALALTGAVLIVDLATKGWAVAQLSSAQARPSTGIVRLHSVLNQGAAFGIGSSRPRLVLVMAFSATVLCLGWLLMTRSAAERLAVATVLGGALGNLVDRAADSTVTDWVQVAGYPFTFNLADLALRVGGLVAVALRLRGS